MTDPTNDDRPIRRVSFSPIPITEPAPSGFFLGWPALIMAVASIISLAGCGQSEAAIPAHKEIPAEACPKGSVGQWVDAITVECLRVIAIHNDYKAHDLARMAVNDLASQLAGPRPEGISEADWEASKAAIRITQSNMKGE